MYYGLGSLKKFMAVDGKGAERSVCQSAVEVMLSCVFCHCLLAL